MKIVALRVKNVGLFSSPVALEDLSGGLDILVGRNETGKSTLFGALQALFAFKHTATGERIDTLRPYVGGEPYVEADIDVGGKRYRLAKQFGRGKFASLLDCATGREVAAGADVDPRLHAMCGGQLGALGVVWVRQKQSLEAFRPSGDETSLLTAAIAREVASAAGGGRALVIRARVNKALDVLTTDKRSAARAGGPLHTAMLRRQDVREGLETARLRAGRAAAAVSRLGLLRQRLAELTDREAVGKLEQELGDAAARLDAGERAHDRLKGAAAEAAAKRLALEKAQAALATFDERLEESDRIKETLATLEVQRDSLAAECQALQGDKAVAEAALATLQREAVDTRAALDAAQRADAARLAARRLADLERMRAEAIDVVRAIEVTAGGIAANGASDELLARIEADQRDIEVCRGRLEAAAPRVQIAYAEGASGQISVDGQTLADGAELRPLGRIVLSIAGVGEISVAGADNADASSDLAALEKRRDALLAQLSATSIEAARGKLAQRRADEARLMALRGQLHALAPGGLAELERQIAHEQRLAVREGNVDCSSLPANIGALRSRLLEIEAQIPAAQSRLEQVQRAIAARNTDLAGLSARAEGARERLAALARAMPAAEEQASQRSRLVAERDAASEVASRSMLDHAALSQSAPDAPTLDRWRQQAAAAREARQSWERERQAVATEIAGLEGQLAGHDDDDAGLDIRVRALEGELARVQGDIDHHERQVGMLKLLDEALAKAALGMRQRLLGPVINRLQPYIEDVLPGARIGHSGSFAPAELTREGTTEKLERLSQGTQEQIAILARLGLARLLADSGNGLPLVLDDALVYSDDDRIEAMGRALERAAAHHQVIVLTCRSHAFAGAAATRLQLGAWSGPP